MQQAPRQNKVTTFKLTEALTHTLAALAERDGCTKDAVIRRMILLGIATDHELQQFHREATQRVAARVRLAAAERPPDRDLETYGIFAPSISPPLLHGLDAETKEAARQFARLYQAADPAFRAHLIEGVQIAEHAQANRPQSAPERMAG